MTRRWHGFRGRELDRPQDPTPKLEKGVLDRFKVSCRMCGRVHAFHPPHHQANRARVHAQAIGWRLGPASRHNRLPAGGWFCPDCKEKHRGPFEPVQITLPGFGPLSRNAK